MNRIELVRGDITQMLVDAIVNAANSSLRGGGGVDGAIHRAGGPQILRECEEYVRKNGRLSVGEAMITSGGNLKARYVIHTVGPIWNGGKSGEDQLLRNAYLSSLRLAMETGLKTIAFPNISTGVYHVPKDRASVIAVNTVKEFLGTHPGIEKVYFVCFDEENNRLYSYLMNSDHSRNPADAADAP
jgi:O-acetyl-ADP-ribose deacetylase (regulator of RNase III)